MASSKAGPTKPINDGKRAFQSLIIQWDSLSRLSLEFLHFALIFFPGPGPGPGEIAPLRRSREGPFSARLLQARDSDPSVDSPSTGGSRTALAQPFQAVILFCSHPFRRAPATPDATNRSTSSLENPQSRNAVSVSAPDADGGRWIAHGRALKSAARAPVA